MVEDMGVATGIDLAAMIDAAAGAERIIGPPAALPGAPCWPPNPQNPCITGATSPGIP